MTDADIPGRPVYYYAHVLRRRWLTILLGGVLGLALAIGYVLVSKPVATATVIGELSVMTSDPFGLDRAPSSLIDVATEESVAGSHLVATKAEERLDGRMGASEIRVASDVQLRSPGTVFSITFTSPDPGLARAGADAVAEGFLEARGDQVQARVADQLAIIEERLSGLQAEQVELLEALGGAGEDGVAVALAEARSQLINQEIQALSNQRLVLSGVSTSGGRILTSAQFTTLNYEPSRVLSAAVGLVLGLLAGLVLAFVRQSSSRRSLIPADVEDATLAPVWRPDAAAGGGSGGSRWRVASELVLGSLSPNNKNIAVVSLSPDIDVGVAIEDLFTAGDQRGPQVETVVFSGLGGSTHTAVATMRRADAVLLACADGAAKVQDLQLIVDASAHLRRSIIGTLWFPRVKAAVADHARSSERRAAVESRSATKEREGTPT